MMGFGRSSTMGAGRQLLPAIALLFLTAPYGASAATLKATLDRNVVPVGESVTLSLVYEGVENGQQPVLPPIPGTSAGPGSYSAETYIINGARSVKLTYSFPLTALQPGDVVIPAIQGSAGGMLLTSQPLALKIIKAEGAAAAAQAALTNLAFLRLVVPKTEVFVGEPVPVEMQLYWQTAQEVHVPQLNADGFSLGPMPKPSQTRTQIGNNIYNLVICQLTVTAARTGTLQLGPAESSLTILVPIANSARTRDPFGFWGRGPDYQPRPTILKSDTVNMQVLPLPKENVPAGFNGAIGSYRMSASAGPTNLIVGDPITVRVQIAGNGPIESLQLPAQAEWRDFTTYPSTARTDVNDPLGLSGIKSFEQVVIPRNHELKMLPPLRFSFFDPQTKEYRTLSSPTVPLNIRSADTAAMLPPGLTNGSAAATPPPADDIVHIRPRLDATRSSAQLLMAQPWFLGAQGAPVLLWLSLLFWRKRADLLANNPRRRRQREVAGRVRDGLKELRAQAGAQKPVEFFATLFRLLQEQLGERLDLPASAITEAVIDERLRGCGTSDEVLKPLRELFQTCNAARYAPSTSSQELTALIPKLEGVLRDLQRLKA
jgi:hypothetical protein